MYNFTVATAHTYFVGDGQWLVHNKCRVSFQPLGGFTGDVLPKGYHINSEVGELTLVPQQLSDGTIRVLVTTTSGSSVSRDVLLGTAELLGNHPDAAIKRAEAIISTFGYDPTYAHRVEQARMLLEAFQGGHYTLGSP